MGLKITGLDEFMNSLEKMQKAAEELETEQSIPFDELFTTSFMEEHTKFKSIYELLESGNFIVNSQEDFEAIPDSELDEHIKVVTDFSTWEEMLASATELCIAKKLGF